MFYLTSSIRLLNAYAYGSGRGIGILDIIFEGPKYRQRLQNKISVTLLHSCINKKIGIFHFICI
jgi:hypothetical protein